MCGLSKEDFIKLTEQGNLIPVFKEVAGDLETPVSTYLKIAAKSKNSFLLESVEGQEKIGRYSFISRQPERVIRFEKNGKENPLKHLRELINQYEVVHLPQLPRFFGGLVGFFSYDVVRFFEKLPDQTTDDLKFPTGIYVLAKEIIVFDHLHHKLQLVYCVHTQKTDSKKQKLAKYNQAIKKLNHLARELQKPLKIATPKKSKQKLEIQSNVSQKEFESIVQEAKKDISRGEIIQVVLSQRFKVKIHTDPFNIYRSLRTVNPSPYMFYLNFDDLKLVGSSPELLVRCEDGLVETRPIAGTRPRGKDEEDDRRLAHELLYDPKEKAEHIMLVDLGRNDLGRVCEDGSVAISEFMAIEKYSHVMHIVSNVHGKLRRDKDALDVLEAAFPAGTVSGAPKIRAMEIIERLERQKRGPYAGCVGYLSYSKNLDCCITIRTIVVRGNSAYVQAGAGIVADSDPAKEYMETVNKARAQIKAIELAHQ